MGKSTKGSSQRSRDPNFQAVKSNIASVISGQTTPSRGPTNVHVTSGPGNYARIPAVGQKPTARPPIAPKKPSRGPNSSAPTRFGRPDPVTAATSPRDGGPGR